jgi:hypothetical protein
MSSEVQPAVAVALIVAQRRPEGRRGIDGGDGIVAEGAHRVEPRGVLGVEHADLGELVPEVELVARDGGLLGRIVAERLRLGEHVAEPREVLVGQREDRAAQQPEVCLPAGQCADELARGDRLALDRDDDIEVEPVLSRGADAEADPRRLGGELECGHLVVRLDPQALDAAQGGEDVREELDRLIPIEIDRGEERIRPAAAQESGPSPGRPLDIGDQLPLRRSVAARTRRVLPLPVEPRDGPRVRERQDDIRSRRLGNGEAAVARDERRDVAQGGQIVVREVGDAGRRDREMPLTEERVPRGRRGPRERQDRVDSAARDHRESRRRRPDGQQREARVEIAEARLDPEAIAHHPQVDDRLARRLFDADDGLCRGIDDEFDTRIVRRQKRVPEARRGRRVETDPIGKPPRLLVAAAAAPHALGGGREVMPPFEQPRDIGECPPARIRAARLGDLPPADPRADPSACRPAGAAHGGTDCDAGACGLPARGRAHVEEQRDRTRRIRVVEVGGRRDQAAQSALPRFSLGPTAH